MNTGAIISRSTEENNEDSRQYVMAFNLEDKVKSPRG
jgi:hypothetical protein